MAWILFVMLRMASGGTL